MMGKKEECAETVQKKNFTDVYVAVSADIYYRRRFHGRRQQCLVSVRSQRRS